MIHNHDSGCSTGKINGTYKTKLGVSGILYQIRCEMKGDGAYFFFIDNEGPEQCYGLMDEAWGGRGGDSTSWTIKGAAPGHQYRSIGKTFKQDGMRAR